MELTDYLRVLRKRWLSIVVLTALALAGAAAATLAATPEYQAETRLFVRAQGQGSVSDLQQGNNFVQQSVQSYADVARTDIVLGPVISELGLQTTPGRLAQQITAEAPLDTVLINITVTDPSPQQAAQIANAVGASLITTVATLEGNGTGTATPVQLTTTQPAVVPAAPSSPNAPLNLALGLLVGLAVGVGLAVLRETLDTTVRGEQDLSQLGLPVLAGMPYDDEAREHPLVVVDQPRGVRAECFRQLRTNLHFATAASGARSVVVTSSLEGEGKSTTAINLALTMAGAGIRVVLVDADLRRPMVATYLGLEGAAGLTTVLVGQASLDDVLQPWGDFEGLSVLTSGGVPPNPSELLASDHMTKLLHELEQRFDVVLLDGAPLLAVTDSAVLSEVVGGALLVVGSGRARRPQVARALQALSAVEATVLGAVVTMLPTKGVDAYQTYAYKYQPLDALKTPKSRRSRAPRSGGETVTGELPAEGGASAPRRPRPAGPRTTRSGSAER
ncbi:capsular exopolysaccharide family [Quadrisphaera granulorum]|uniref:non-specific protein-tyrosine kinase n=1 Tax=Quadrisphaera granulorum TaxID=317664 RepID=A0A316AFM9_9ACTN|nr:polysaccharide biosynthesis tyrosine autokinase [Quadrisphaera granulorum]PWJ56058.1 capsular exopolysaccharide synthesis family protein [Quadrisphaera granulorum]SZE94692.1 capsular exopolysaccharide family [Quadrisphaera granulorum]